MRKPILFISSLLIFIMLLVGCGNNSQVDPQECSDLLTSYEWGKNTLGTLDYDSDGTWFRKTLYGGQDGTWTISGDTLTEIAENGKETSYSYITGITDQDVEEAMDSVMTQDKWKNKWYVSDQYLVVGKEVYKAYELPETRYNIKQILAEDLE